MKTILLLLLVALVPGQSSLDGTWRMTDDARQTVVLTMMDNYLMQTTYEPSRFIATRGGACQYAGGQLRLTVEFDTQDSTRIGQTETYAVAQTGGRLQLGGSGTTRTFTAVDERAKTPLAGLWRITGRANDAGQVTTMQRGPRKTIKLLTNGRFQWAAINPETKQFFGTGGGTYQFANGQYTETIDFFSRDNSRVGRSLTFEGRVDGNTWNHTGKSSTGGPVNEVWTRE